MIENKPLLIRILLDVSASMTTSMENKAGTNVSRLESFENKLQDMIKKVM